MCAVATETYYHYNFLSISADGTSEAHASPALCALKPYTAGIVMVQDTSQSG